MRAVLLMFTLLLIAAGGDARAAGAYRWVDQDGKVHYSDQPRAGAVAVKARPGASVQAPAKPQTAKDEEDPEVAADRRIADCARRKEQLESYQKSVRIVEKNNLGEEREYTAEDKARLIEITEQQIAETCEEPS